MSINNIANNVQKTGLCPHGLPPGACPICSGGGGGVAKMDRNTRRHPGELTWNECYALGQMMKAAQARKELAELQHQNAQLQNLQAQQRAEKFAQIFSSINNFISNIPILKKSVNFIQSTVAKLSNVIHRQTQAVLHKFTSGIKNIINDISDKLAAILGEEKLAKMKNIEKFIERAKNKLLTFLGIIAKTREEEETSEIVKQEEKKISFLDKIRRKLNLIKDENINDDN